ncbi:hypothetical protein BCT30_13915 [Enterovibrio norvegicus]|uniref:Uncharacterized protein n=2 Tax=Enterovibrio norvegicus TaxID=188144 RepID=A0A1I5JF65_9GAMM|nr:DUF5713 family protein [Enterovibrio norvegicus]MCC4800660.1 DUF5713 family protein [Enterovibrio norvegicus]OEE50694.1 hypothetical protein A1OS_23340 [Enterovibrio norvegicus]OEF56782.1 hypothetical protein A1OU_18690 [Enterovibrio norvegicus]OEF63819.1 hypothetical protein A1OW_17905 [Enterovibrio norvegicus]PMI38553.1 hypothetical protein BCU46_00820 [Enterovibrio norvegicus]
MSISNEKMKAFQFLPEMYRDSYFPNFLVDKIKAILIDLCQRIESNNPLSSSDLLVLTHAATERINALQEEFEDNDSDLETAAREDMAESFEFIIRSYGFFDVDIEDVIAPREW